MTSTASSIRASGILRLSLATFGLLALQPALAKQDDRNQPMVVQHANSFDGFNAPNTVSTLKGNVLITQGTMKVTGDLAKIYVDADTQVSRIVVTMDAPGRLAHIEELDDNNNLITGDADKLDYDNVNGIAVLTGHAVVHQQGRGEAHGDKLTYNTQTSYITGDSGGNGLVHMIFLPKPKPVKPATAKPGAAAPAAPTGTPAATNAAKPAGTTTTPAKSAEPASSSSTSSIPTAAPASASSSATPTKG